MTYRVLLLQGREIYCHILLIPEMGKETFLSGGVGVRSPFKKNKNSRNVEFLKA
jgi:hypothetical protein